MTIAQFVSRVTVLLFFCNLPTQAQISVYAFITKPFDARFDTMKTVQRAFKAWDASNWKQSVSLFDAAIKQYPQEAELYTLRGVAKFYSGAKKPAADDILNALKIAPQYYATAKKLMASSMLTYANETTLAIKILDDLIQNPDNNTPELLALAYGCRGQAKALEKDYKSAIKDYTEYFKHTSNVDINFVLLWSWANWFEGNKLETIYACDSLLTPQAMSDIGEDAANITRGIRGASKFYQKDYTGCITDLTTIAKIAELNLSGENNKIVVFVPNDERNLCLAHSYLFTNNYSKAEKIYKAELKKSPTFATALRTDLQKFKEYGTVHPDLAKVEALLPK